MKSSPPRMGDNLSGHLSGDTDPILRTIFQIFPDLLFYLDEDGIIINYLASDNVTFPFPPENCVGKHIMEVLPQNAANLFFAAITKTLQSGQISSLEYDLERENETRSYTVKCLQIKNTNLVVIIRDVTDQKRKTDSANRYQKFMDSLQESARQLSKELDSKALCTNITRSCVDLYGVQQAWLGWLKPGHSLEEMAYASAKNVLRNKVDSGAPTVQELNYIIEKRSPLVIEPNHSVPDVRQTRAFFPMMAQDQVVGVLGLKVETQGFFTPEIVDFFQAFILLASSAVQNTRLYEDSRRQLSQMETLRSIDQAILSNLDLRSMAAVILKEAAKHIHVDALALLVLDPKTQMLNFVDGFGFHYETLRHSHIKLGESFAGQVAQDKRMIYVGNLQEDPKSFARAAKFKEEGFQMYLGTPLIARSEVRGVLEIFQRQPFEPDEDWYMLLETLANQIAIAIDNTLLVKFLKDSNLELNSAYDATIEGLSRALELRDRETEGHTRRVAKMTVDLARRMGVLEADMPQIYQGALLHDIGKMGIPDAILLKPGALLPEEWEVMKQHPLFAYQLLSQVEHLQQAIDIPLYHHEKWDGSGYPYGLKGEQIPSAARLFSIVDVYDALTSDRPYRSAWPKDKTLNYLQMQAGIFFDPEIVPVFRQLILRDTIPIQRDARNLSKTTPLNRFLK